MEQKIKWEHFSFKKINSEKLIASLILWIILIGSAYFFNNYQISWTIVISIGIISTILIYLVQMEIPVLACLIIISLGSFYVVVNPVLDTPDEIAHLGRAYYVSEGNFLMEKKYSDIFISKDFEIINNDIYKNFSETSLTDYKHTSEKVNAPQLSATNTNLFISYLPQALGLFIGKILNLNLFSTFLLGRFFNLITYALLVKKALEMAGKWQIPLAFIACMPMMLFLAASYNPDAISMGITFITLALFIKLTQKETILKKELITYTLLCVLLSTIKLPYVALIGLLFFLKPKNYTRKNFFSISVICLSITGIISMVWLFSYLSVVPVHRPEGVNAVAQVKSLLSSFEIIIKVIVSTVFMNISRYKMLFSFGWLSYESIEVAFLHLFAFGAICVSYPLKIQLSKLNKLGMVIIAVAISVLINLSQYLTWTPVGTELVQGVQGRYFIGVYAMFPLFLNQQGSLYAIDSINDAGLKKYNRMIMYLIIYFIILMFSLMLGNALSLET